jgi:hypothetical protein
VVLAVGDHLALPTVGVLCGMRVRERDARCRERRDRGNGKGSDESLHLTPPRIAVAEAAMEPRRTIHPC